MERSQSPESSGRNVSVTINNGSTTSNVGRVGGGRQLVTITPLPPGASVKRPPFNPTPRAHRPSSGVIVQPLTATEQQLLPANVLQHSGGPRQVAYKLDKVFLKATYKEKKEVKKFTLRNIDPTLMTSSSDLKDLIKTNFYDDIKSGDFDVGSMVGTEIVRVRTEEDLKEMWGEIRKNWCTALWCDGLVDNESGKSSKSSKPGHKRKHAASDEESDDEATSSQSTKTQKKMDNETKVK